MVSVADCLRQHGGAYLNRYGDSVPLGHRKVLSAITRCRTGELGGVLYQCDRCDREHWVGRSCGNRHCPTCGIDKTADWLEEQTARLLLAPYIYRVAISDKRIEACDQSSVTYSYTPSGSKKSLTRNVPGERFVGGFLQHSLPRGFHKVRYYGWMNSSSAIELEEVQWLVWLFLGWTFWLASGYAPQEQPIERPGVRCAECGGPMRIVKVVHENCRTLVEHSVAYLDSG